MSFKILTVDFLSEDAPKKFVRSLRDSGFAVLKNHPISGDLLKEVYKNWKDFSIQKRNTATRFTKISRTDTFHFNRRMPGGTSIRT